MTSEQYISTLLSLRELIDGALAEAGHVIGNTAPLARQLNREEWHERACAAVEQVEGQSGMSWAQVSAIIGQHPKWNNRRWPSDTSLRNLKRRATTLDGLKDPTKIQAIAEILEEYLNNQAGEAQ